MQILIELNHTVAKSSFFQMYIFSDLEEFLCVNWKEPLSGKKHLVLIIYHII